MSLIGGCSVQPESLMVFVMSTGAPHAGQDRALASLGCRQYGHTYAFIAGYSPDPWWWYMDWMPTRPGPVISARYMPCLPNMPVFSGSCTACMPTVESLYRNPPGSTRIFS